MGRERRLTVLRQQVLEKVEVTVLLGLLCDGYEEANEEQDDDEQDEGDGVFESAP